MNDRLYMQRALDLARLGAGNVSPNPMVGAVIVADGAIIGEGWHRRYGQPHAEVNAVESVGDPGMLSRATLYVTLEPCSHWGNTPPCADLIVSKRIARVVVGVVDPNPLVAGRGIEIMREAGIDVTVGVLEEKCREMNKRFFTFQQQGRPYVILKWAQTSDGFMDAARPDGTAPAWMTGEAARILVHRWRAENDAILVGTNTVLNDNPSLTVRSWHGPDPVRVIPDGDLRLDPSLRVFDSQAKTILFTKSENLEKAEVKFSANKTVEIDTLNFDCNSVPQILEKLAARRMTSLLVEGGAAMLNSFIELGLWDEARIFTSSLALGDLYTSMPDPAGIPAPAIKCGQCRLNHYSELNLDILIR